MFDSDFGSTDEDEYGDPDDEEAGERRLENEAKAEKKVCTIARFQPSTELIESPMETEGESKKEERIRRPDSPLCQNYERASQESCESSTSTARVNFG